MPKKFTIPDCDDVLDARAWIQAQIGVNVLWKATAEGATIDICHNGSASVQAALTQLFSDNIIVEQVSGKTLFVSRKKYPIPSKNEVPEEPLSSLAITVKNVLVEKYQNFPVATFFKQIEELDWRRRFSPNAKGIGFRRGAMGEILLDAAIRSSLAAVQEALPDMEVISPVFSNRQKREQIQDAAESLFAPDHILRLDEKGCYIFENQRVIAEYENAIIAFGSRQALHLLFLDATAGKVSVKEKKGDELKQIIQKPEDRQFVDVLGIGFRRNCATTKRTVTLPFGELIPRARFHKRR